MSVPCSSVSGWVLRTQNGLQGLEFHDKLPLPPISGKKVLVKLHAASLNHRDLIICQGKYGAKVGKESLVPGSDGAGEVQGVGADVTAFSVGDKVCTVLSIGLPEDQAPTFDDISVGLGQSADGTLRQYAIFDETSLVKMPAGLSYREAATLTCSALTAWNALFGIESKAPRRGQVVLVQGTGGVSIAALQFSLATGATVVATTSNPDKVAKLKRLGAHQVFCTRDTPVWGSHVKRLTPGGKGFDLIVDVGGASTLAQSMAAIRPDGLVAATGVLGDPTEQTPVPTMIDCIYSSCTVRGFFLGSRKQLVQMNEFIESHNIKPLLDDETFEISSVREAYAAMMEQKHFSKIVINLG